MKEEKKTTTENKQTTKKATPVARKKRVFKNTPKKTAPKRKTPRKRPPRKDEGRPSKYLKKYNKDIIAHMKKGYSVQAFAGVVGVTEQTLYNWMATYPEFLESVKRGVAVSRLHWERVGYIGMQGKTPGFNSTAWIFNMKNRFKWGDRMEIVTPLDKALAEESDEGEESVNPDDPAEALGKIVAKYGKQLIIAGKNQASRT